MYQDASGTEYEGQIRQDMERSSRIRAKFGTGHKLLDYDVAHYSFREALVRRLIALGFISEDLPLENLHKVLAPEQMLSDLSGQNEVAIACYDCGDELRSIYYRFLKEFIEPNVAGEPLVFQDEITFRFSFPESPGYTWRPNYHTDAALGHPPQEINIWFPLTPCYPGNSLIYGDLEDSMRMWRRFDYNFSRYHSELDTSDSLQDECARLTRPLACDYGQLFVFDSRCMHLSQVNRTDQTRVSIDLRVVPLTDFEQIELTYIGTGRKKSRFEPGGFYATQTSEELTL